uniref:Uncharacterized protein n=1 Tax=Picea sitchensis TaxID=3332 RepID=A9NSQ6_PICSI|nr:unknown [Picea sitchensis]
MRKNDGQCIDEPLGFLWGIPLTIMASVICMVGMVVWILGMLLTLICPGLMRDTILVEVAAELVRAPLYTTECFTGSKRLPPNHNGLSGKLPVYSYYTL